MSGWTQATPLVDSGLPLRPRRPRHAEARRRTEGFSESAWPVFEGFIINVELALAMQPRLMLLDEVTSALDPELVAEVLNVIRGLAEAGMTMLIATHEMGFARDIASRVCFLDEGVILEEGPPDQIFRAPGNQRTAQFLQRIIEAGRL